MEIKKTSHILQDEKSLADFYKTEKLASESSFYCLWPNPEYFYLYHIQKEEFWRKDYLNRSTSLMKWYCI